jgi:AcrR family transcriptional regulator
VSASAPETAALSPRLAQIVDAAEDLLEEQGPDGLTMRTLAARLGIQAPSLYKHVAGKDELEVLLIAQIETAAVDFICKSHRDGWDFSRITSALNRNGFAPPAGRDQWDLAQTVTAYGARHP